MTVGSGHRVIVGSIAADYVLTYGQGVVTVPKLVGSKILVFTDLDWAKKFWQSESGSYNDLQIWSCEVDSLSAVKYLSYFKDLGKNDFWSKLTGVITFKDVLEISGWYNAPTGTHGCNSCKLLERIHARVRTILD